MDIEGLRSPSVSEAAEPSCRPPALLYGFPTWFPLDSQPSLHLGCVAAPLTLPPYKTRIHILCQDP